MAKHLFCILAVSLGLWSGIAQGQLHEWTADPLRAVQIKTVAFRGWTPDGPEPLRGTLVLIPGRLSDGRGMAADPEWQAFATEVRFALLACQFTDGDPNLYQYDEKKEVAKAINTAVGRLAELSSHPELNTAPLALWGHSAGSNLAANHANFVPNRVIALAGIKGSWGPGSGNPPGKERIPMLFVIGGKDDPNFVSGPMPHIEAGLKRNAPWLVALQKNEGHDAGPSLPLARAFLKASIEQRFSVPQPGVNAPNVFKTAARPMSSLNRMAAPAAPVKLEKIDPRFGWLGDPETYEVAQPANFKGKKSKAMWLPDETTAKAWQEYLRR